MPPRDPPRLLHRRSQYGYTDKPEKGLPGAGEAVTRDEVETMARQNRDRFDAEHAEQLRRKLARSRAARLREAEMLAAARKVDVSAIINRIDQGIEEIRTRLKSSAQSV